MPSKFLEMDNFENTSYNLFSKTYDIINSINNNIQIYSNKIKEILINNDNEFPLDESTTKNNIFKRILEKAEKFPNF